MKRNPLIPFALIAALGIIVMFVFSFQGLNKSKELADTVLSLPLYYGMSDDEINYVIDIINKFE